MPRLRLSLTLPGTTSLRAYEGGALAALIVAAKELGEDVVVIDSIATASPGSITGLLAAQSLLSGIDPVAFLASAFVANESLRPMHAGSTTGASTGRQDEPIWLSMAFTTPGHPTRLPHDLASETTMQAERYIVTLRNRARPHEYLAYADAVIAAGSEDVGPPSHLGNEPLREDTGLVHLPEDGLFWYTDGGTVDNEPLSRTIDLAEHIASDEERLYLVISPDSAFPTRSLSCEWGHDVLTPSIYEELERIERTASRSESIAPDAAVTHCNGDWHNSQTHDRGTHAIPLRSSLKVAIAAAYEAVCRRQADIASTASRILAEREADHSDDYASLLESLYRSANGPAHARRQPVPVEVISPEIDPSVADPPARQLVGAFFSQFGDLTSATLLQSDFCLGYRNMSYWIEHRLHSYLPLIDLSAALEILLVGYDGIGESDCYNERIPAPSTATEGAGEELAFLASNVIAHDFISREA